MPWVASLARPARASPSTPLAISAAFPLARATASKRTRPAPLWRASIQQCPLARLQLGTRFRKERPGVVEIRLADSGWFTRRFY